MACLSLAKCTCPGAFCALCVFVCLNFGAEHCTTFVSHCLLASCAAVLFLSSAFVIV